MRTPRPPPPGLVQAETFGGEVVTPSGLITQRISGDPSRPAPRGRRVLQLRGLAVATVGPDPASVTPMCAVSARDMPVVDTLAAVAAHDPTGVLLIETRDTGFAFEVKNGRIIGARGTGPQGHLESWIAELQRRHPSRFASGRKMAPNSAAWLEVARMFVEERALEQLALCREPGARLTLARGDIEWVGSRIPEHSGLTLHHLLLEHARRCDEEPRIIASLGALDRIAVPMRGPEPRPSIAMGRPSVSDEDWQLLDEPDPAAITDWDDAVRVWSLCDGQSTISEIVDDSVLGRFRCLLALRTLAKAGHLVFIDSGRIVVPASNDSPLAVVLRLPRPPAVLRIPERNAAADDESGLAIVDPAKTSAQRPVVALTDDDMIASDPSCDESATAYSFVMHRPMPRRRPAAKDPVPPPPVWAVRATQRVVEPIDELTIRRGGAAPPVDEVDEAFASADTKREPIVANDGCGESGHDMRLTASGSLARAIRRALPSQRSASFALALTGVVAMAAAVIALVL